MLNDPQEFLRYFDSIHRRTLRDIEALPPPAEDWAPPVGEGEKSWSIAQIVHHICESRMYFARAYRNEGWLYDWPVPSTEQQSGWIPALEESHAEFHRRLDDTPPEWLRRRIKMIDTDGTLSGWRILMMLIEHEVHHRSQIDTYSGLNGWDVPQIYGRTRERIDECRNRREVGPEGDLTRTHFVIGSALQGLTFPFVLSLSKDALMVRQARHERTNEAG